MISQSEEEALAALVALDLLGNQRFAEVDKIVLLAADICGASLASFTVHDIETAHEVSSSFAEPGIMPRAECMCGAVLAGGGTVHVNDARIDPRFARARYVASAPHVRCFIGVPVGPEPRLPIGVLAIGHTEPGAFGPREIARLQKVSELVSVFLAHRRNAIRANRAAARTEDERRRQHLFELIFDAIQEGVAVHAPGRGIVELNPASLSIMGLTREEVSQRGYSDPRWRTIRPDGTLYRANEFPPIATFRSGEAMQNLMLGNELPSGEVRWLSVNTVPLRNQKTGEVDFAVVTMKDVTGQYLAEKRLTEQNARLAAALEEAERANRAKSDFMGVMSHELRTPMNAIMSCALLLSQSKLDPVQTRTLGVLKDAGRQMLAVLNDLLDLSTLDADKVRIRPEPVSLLRLIEGAAVIWGADVRAKGLSLSVMVDPALSAPRNADSARVLQIIGNLFANAVKFTQEGGISLQAWPERGPDGAECVIIEVEDSGPGVPAEAVERIFQPFEQIDVSASRRNGGLGLGLHIARRLAIAMGGDVELETESGRGARFTLRITAPLTAGAEQEADGSPVRDLAAMRVRNILCVDDNPRNLYVAGALLREAGHRSTECACGEEALELMAREKFDVVLLDMVMPGMDGLDVLARLRAGRGPNALTPVIAFTANVLPHQIETYNKAGMAGFLAKPIDVEAMLRAVAGAA